MKWPSGHRAGPPTDPVGDPRNAGPGPRGKAAASRLARGLLILALLVATGLRFHGLAAQSFWNDEGNSARLSERPVPLILAGTASDIHPPLYYLALSAWRDGVGESEFGLRALSALAGVLTVAATAALAKNALRAWGGAGGRPGALGASAALAALAVAFNPALIYYAQEARMYALLALLATLATVALLRLMSRQHAVRDRRGAGPGADWPATGAYIILAAAGLYTHYFFPAFLLAHLLVVAGWMGLVWRRERRLPWHLLGRWSLIAGLILLAYLPWLPIHWRQAFGRPGTAGPAAGFGPAIARFLVVGPAAPRLPVGVGEPAVALLLGLGLAGLAWRRRWASLVLLALVSLTPPGVMLLAQATRPAFFKFSLGAIPPLAILAASGIVTGAAYAFRSGPGPLRLGRIAMALAALLGLVFWAGQTREALGALYGDTALFRADYREMARRIAADDHPNAAIILNAPNQWEVFTYYHRSGAPVYPLPRSQADPVAIGEELNQILTRHDRLYVLFWGDAEQDPERLVERWLDTHAFKATEAWYQDVRFVMYAAPGPPAATATNLVNGQFGPDIVLTGYTLGESELRPGDVIPLSLFWRTQMPLTVRYKVFIHLVDPAGNLVAQRDAEPGGGLTLTTTWTPGQLVPDHHGLLVPLSATTGPYFLRIGLYELSHPEQRLLLETADGSSDALVIGPVEVRRNREP